MKIADSIFDIVNYGLTNVDHTFQKISSQPGMVKKVLQFASKSFDAFDLYYTSEIQSREITQIMKGTIDFIGVYGSYKQIMYWVYLFSKENLDQEALQKSIESSLSASHIEDNNSDNRKKLAQNIFTAVMAKKSYHSKGEVLKTIKISLGTEGYSDDKVSEIAGHIIIQQKGRSLNQILSAACFTVADVGTTILNLKKWHILDLSKVAFDIGSQSRLFIYVADLGSGVILGGAASVGLILSVGEKSYKMGHLAIRHYSASPGDKEEAYKELRAVGIDLLVGVTDLAATATPLLFTLSPATIIALAIIAKGTGIVCFLIKE